MKHFGGDPLHGEARKRPDMEGMPIANMKKKCGDCIVMKTDGECDKIVNTLGCDIKTKRFNKHLSDKQETKYDEDTKDVMEDEEKKSIKDLLDSWSTNEKDDDGE